MAMAGVIAPARQRYPGGRQSPSPLGKSADDPGGGSILHVEAQVARLIHELGEYLDRADQMEKNPWTSCWR